MSEVRLKYLFERHLAKVSTPVEKEELAALVLEADNDALVKELVTQSWEKTGDDEDMPAEKAKLILEAILQATPEEIPLQRSNVRWVAWRRIAVAASIILAIGVGSYFLFFNHTKQSE